MLRAIGADINPRRKKKTMELEQSPLIETGGPVEIAFHEWYQVERPIGWLPKEYTDAKVAFFRGFNACIDLSRTLSDPEFTGEAAIISQIQADVVQEVGWFSAGMPTQPTDESHN